MGEPPLRQDPERAQRLGELESSNAMWGWIAGGIVLALLLLFVFGRTPDMTNTASTEPPPASTSITAAPPAPTANPNQPAGAMMPRTPPTTTGQAPASGSQ